MKQSSIHIDVALDQDKVPELISWTATDSLDGKTRDAKAMMLSLWDGEEKTAMRIDLWTKEMMLDEMADFFYQTMMTMADTYQRATHQSELVNDLRAFAREFHQKFRANELKEQKH